MAEPSFPICCEAVTPQWLTAALGGEAKLGGTIIGFDAARVGEGVGFLGVVNRLSLRYQGEAAGAPRTIIAKVPSPDPGARMITTTFRQYEKEVRFYEQCAVHSPMRTARSYYQAFDAESGDFALLLEDLAPRRNGDHLAGLSVAEARLAVEGLAQQQASWWESPALARLDWLPFFDDPSMLPLQDVFIQCWPAYCGFFGEALSPEMRALGERLGPKIRTIMTTLSQAPTTLVHGDFRADNFFFDGERLTVVDWQIVMRGRGAFDLAYLITGNLDPASRRASEANLVRLYSDTLAAGGVQDYDFEDAWRDYRLCALFGWIWPVVAIGSLDAANQRGMAVFHAWSHRVTSAIEELGAADVLDAY
ncbi:MAG TPA: phosphotransferase [Phenylobacterium sp.]